MANIFMIRKTLAGVLFLFATKGIWAQNQIPDIEDQFSCEATVDFVGDHYHKTEIISSKRMLDEMGTPYAQEEGSFFTLGVGEIDLNPNSQNVVKVFFDNYTYWKKVDGVTRPVKQHFVMGHNIDYPGRAGSRRERYMYRISEPQNWYSFWLPYWNDLANGMVFDANDKNLYYLFSSEINGGGRRVEISCQYLNSTP